MAIVLSKMKAIFADKNKRCSLRLNIRETVSWKCRIKKHFRMPYQNDLFEKGSLRLSKGINKA